jgi:hypothetical protein
MGLLHLLHPLYLYLDMVMGLLHLLHPLHLDMVMGYLHLQGLSHHLRVGLPFLHLRPFHSYHLSFLL